MKNPFVRRASEIDRLRKSLGEHSAQIRRLLSAPDRDATNAHYFLAANLRPLLCDRYPILIRYADIAHHDLRIWGPNLNDITHGSNVIMSVPFLVASYENNPLLVEKGIREYLQTPVGVANWQKYTPTEIIKLVANKEGAAHLEPDQNDKLEDIRSAFVMSASIFNSPNDDNEVILRTTILQIAHWALRAIEEVLALPLDSGK